MSDDDLLGVQVEAGQQEVSAARADVEERRRKGGVRRAALTVIVVSLVVGASACSSAVSAPGSVVATATTGSTGTTGASQAACVRDPSAVVKPNPDGRTKTAALPADLVAKLDAAARQSFQEAATPGAIVGVRTPQGTWTAAYGVADPATGQPMTTGLYHRIASVTKTFTGTLILQLAEQRKVSLDDPISKYVPNIPSGDRITLAMLADMTAGLASYSNNKAFTDDYFAHPSQVYTPDQLLAAGISQPSLFPPGSDFSYSNTNTVLLGMVVEKVTGRPFGTVLQEKILIPLGLDHTSWSNGSAAFPGPHAQGFTLKGPTATPSKPANATDWNPSWGWVAGEMISDAGDMLTWDQSLATGKGLLSSQTQTERLRSVPGPAGYGLGIACVDGWVGHTGDISGYNTAAFYDTNSATSVIVETNSDVPSGNCQVEQTLTDDPGEAVCGAPAVRMFVALSTALGNTAHPPAPK